MQQHLQFLAARLAGSPACSNSIIKKSLHFLTDPWTSCQVVHLIPQLHLQTHTQPARSKSQPSSDLYLPSDQGQSRSSGTQAVVLHQHCQTCKLVHSRLLPTRTLLVCHLLVPQASHSTAYHLHQILFDLSTPPWHTEQRHAVRLIQPIPSLQPCTAQREINSLYCHSTSWQRRKSSSLPAEHDVGIVCCSSQEYSP